MCTVFTFCQLGSVCPTPSTRVFTIAGCVLLLLFLLPCIFAHFVSVCCVSPLLLFCFVFFSPLKSLVCRLLPHSVLSCFVTCYLQTAAHTKHNCSSSPHYLPSFLLFLLSFLLLVFRFLVEKKMQISRTKGTSAQLKHKTQQQDEQGNRLSCVCVCVRVCVFESLTRTKRCNRNLCNEDANKTPTCGGLDLEVGGGGHRKSV